jgi:F0F1-type ATP synthase assembly protein I
MPQDYNPRQLAHYFALSQVGLEMAAPIGVGYLIDLWLGSLPWVTIGGAVLGLIGGLWHLVALSKKPPPDDPSEDSKR